MGFNRRKLEAEQKAKPDAAAANRRATDAQVFFGEQFLGVPFEI